MKVSMESEYKIFDEVFTITPPETSLTVPGFDNIQIRLGEGGATARDIHQFCCKIIEEISSIAELQDGDKIAELYTLKVPRRKV